MSETDIAKMLKVELGLPWAIQAHRSAASIAHIVDADGDNLFTSVFRPFAKSVVALVNRSAASTAREAALVEALQGLLHDYKQLVDSGDCGFWDSEKVPSVIAARAVLDH